MISGPVNLLAQNEDFMRRVADFLIGCHELREAHLKTKQAAEVAENSEEKSCQHLQPIPTK